MRRTAIAVAAVLVTGQALASGIPGQEALVITPQSGDLQGRADSGSEGVIDREQLRNRPLTRNADVIEVVPGVISTQHSGAGKANQYFLRGMNLDHGTDFAVHVDGMPINMPTHGHGQGYADLNFLIPELIDRVHYHKGTYFADDGDFSAAGSARVYYRNSLDQRFVDLGLGSRGYRRALLGGSAKSGGGTLLGAVEVAHDDGPWTLPQNYNKFNGVIRWSGNLPVGEVGLTLMGYRGEWAATDQVPQRALDSGRITRFGNIDPTDGGQSSRVSLSGSWFLDRDEAEMRASFYVVSSRLDLFSNFTYFQRDAVNGDQFEQVDRRRIGGGDVTRLWRSQLGDWPVEHQAGIRLRMDDIDEVGLFSTVARQRFATTRTDRVRQSSLGAWYQASISLTPWLRVVPGLRRDGMAYRVASNNAANSGRGSAAIVSPKFALIASPTSSTELFADWGRGFHSNDVRGATITVDPSSGAPAQQVTPLVRATGSEIGIRTVPIQGWHMALSLWRLDIASELVFVGDAGSTQASRPSARRGIEWSNVWSPLRDVTVDADYTLSRARFADSDPAGNLIPGAMSRTLSVGATAGAATGWQAGTRLRYFGPRPLIADGSQRAAASTLVNLKLGYVTTQRHALTLDVINLFDRKANDIEYFYASRLAGEAAAVSDRHIHPVEPRTVRISVKLALE